MILGESSPWGPVLFATLVPIATAGLVIALRLTFLLASVLRDIQGDLKDQNRRLDVLETAALEGAPRARERKRELEA